VNAASAVIHGVVLRYRRARAAHPVRTLRWQRNGVLLAVAAIAFLDLIVATRAHAQITAARRTEHAVEELDNASMKACDAASRLRDSFQNGDVSLTGAGTAFENDTAAVGTDVTAAAQGNAAGADGAAHFQFVQGQLTSVSTLAETAVQDFGRLGKQAANEALLALVAPDQQELDTTTTTDAGGLVTVPRPCPSGATTVTGGGALIATLADLSRLESDALAAQRGSVWLRPGFCWPLLVVPLLVLLSLAIATTRLVARHFRMMVSPLLPCASLAVGAVVGTVLWLSIVDDSHLSANPQAGHPITLTIGMTVLATASVLAYAAYRPLLAEYRFEARS
jgi:hypothetical protein